MESKQLTSEKKLNDFSLKRKGQERQVIGEGFAEEAVYNLLHKKIRNHQKPIGVKDNNIKNDQYV